jgi:DNA-binding Xre family transcriptional regulator
MEKNRKCFDRIELKVAMVRKDYKQKTLAKEIGLSHATFIKKMHGKAPFKDSDILKIKDALDLSSRDLIRIFFKEQKLQTR